MGSSLQIYKLLIFFVGILFCIVLSYFLFNPLWLYISDRNFYSFIKLYNYEEARNYYSIIQSISSVIFSVVGIVLGLFYFFKKINIDERNQKMQKKEFFTEKLLSAIDSYDFFVKRILYDKISKKQASGIARELGWEWDKIEDLIEFGVELKKMENELAKDILAINSFVDKNENIANLLNTQFSKIDNHEIGTFINEFQLLIKKAKLACYSNLKEGAN